MAQRRETQKETEQPQREKQLAHGAQSDQGGKGQRIDLGGEEPDAYEGPEESNQQRR